MTRPLRRAHLRIWMILAIAITAIFAASIALRRDTTPPNSTVDWSRLK